jgi:hypothetical protein
LCPIKLAANHRQGRQARRRQFRASKAAKAQTQTQMPPLCLHRNRFQAKSTMARVQALPDPTAGPQLLILMSKRPADSSSSKRPTAMITTRTEAKRNRVIRHQANHTTKTRRNRPTAPDRNRRMAATRHCSSNLIRLTSTMATDKQRRAAAQAPASLAASEATTTKTQRMGGSDRRRRMGRLMALETISKPKTRFPAMVLAANRAQTVQTAARAVVSWPRKVRALKTVVWTTGAITEVDNSRRPPTSSRTIK